MQTKADTSITFTCPECAALLRVSQKKAGISGPCPKCNSIIHSPSGKEKSQVPNIEEDYTTSREPNEIIRKKPLQKKERKTSKPDEIINKPASNTKGTKTIGNILIYSISILIIFLSGFYAFTILTENQNSILQSDSEEKNQEKEPLKIKEPLVEGNENQIITDNKNTEEIAIDAAKISLKKFLTATTISEKARYVLNAERLLPKMIEYHESHPTYQESSIDGEATNQNDDSNFRIFYVTTKQQRIPFPVFLENTNRGWKVNWVAFTQYNENSLGNFLEQYQPGERTFYAKLQRAHYFGSNIPELGSKIGFKIDPIVSDASFVFAERDSSMAQYTNNELDWEKVYYPMIRLEWVNTEPSKPYVRVIEILQIGWPSPESRKATLSSTESN